MDIKKTIKEHHQAMIDKGFYDCPDCEKGHPGQIFRYGEYMDCPNCGGSNINPNKNIGELLMLIVSELGEALEAHRNNNFCAEHILDKAIEYQSISKKYIMYYENCVKNSLEDEIADVFLRLFDLCGYIVESENYDVVTSNIDNSMADLYDPCNYGEWMFRFIKYYLVDIMDGSDKNHIPAGAIGRAIASLFRFCKRENIPIEKHIFAKMAYDKTRPHKHGKEY